MTEKSNKKWIAIVLIGLCILAVPVGLAIKSGKTDSDTSDSSGGSLMKLKDRIEVINLNGPIVDKDEEGLFSMNRSPYSSVKKLKKILKNDKVKGVLIRINSPGGTVGTSQEICQAVSQVAAEKPVVTSMGDICASGGYYIACASNKIVANPGTLTGSIGVIFNMMNVKGLADKVGIEPKVIKSGPYKDIASMFRPMTEDERKILQDLIDDSYDQFVTAVSQGRKMKMEVVKKLADGRIYSGRQALKNGLVDKLGSYNDALDELQTMCRAKYNLKKDLPVNDDTPNNIFEAILDSSSSDAGFLPMNLLNLLNGRSHTSLEASMQDKLLPIHMQCQFSGQPLWIMAP